MGYHFVPRRYLQNFENAGRPGFIWLHDKREGCAHIASIGKVAQTKGFYSVETEKFLAHNVETPGNAVIEKLTSGKAITITPGERLQLASYIGVMLKRIPTSRRRAAEMIPSVLAGVISNTREQLEMLAREGRLDPELLARRFQEVEEAETKFTVRPPQEVLNKIREPWPSEDMLRALFGMVWRVLVSSGPQYFITTDNPVFFFRAFGLAREQSEFVFPLSTTHALHGSWWPASSDLVFLPAKQSVVKEFNRRLASETERLAFYHGSAPWLLTMLRKKHLFLNIIHWMDERG